MDYSSGHGLFPASGLDYRLGAWMDQDPGDSIAFGQCPGGCLSGCLGLHFALDGGPGCDSPGSGPAFTKPTLLPVTMSSAAGWILPLDSPTAFGAGPQPSPAYPDAGPPPSTPMLAASPLTAGEFAVDPSVAGLSPAWQTPSYHTATPAASVVGLGSPAHPAARAVALGSPTRKPPSTAVPPGDDSHGASHPPQARPRRPDITRDMEERFVFQARLHGHSFADIRLELIRWGCADRSTNVLTKWYANIRNGHQFGDKITQQIRAAVQRAKPQLEACLRAEFDKIDVRGAQPPAEKSLLEDIVSSMMDRIPNIAHEQMLKRRCLTKGDIRSISHLVFGAVKEPSSGRGAVVA